MWTFARPVRVERRFARKSSTDFSMRDFNCAYTFFNAGLLAMVDAIGVPAFLKPIGSPL
jgi:hypothetical protein